MDKNNKALLGLPLVRFAPFMAAGMLTAYFGGGLVCGIVSAAAAAVTVLCALKHKCPAIICASGMLWGIIVMSAYVHLYCAPISEFGGKTVRAEIRVNEISYIGSGTREYIVEMNLAGRKANVRVTGGDFADVGIRAAVIAELAEPDSDDELQNLADGILLEGIITEVESVAAEFDITAPIKRLRGIMIEELSAHVFGERAELALSMLLGEDGGLSPSLREKLKICGAAHYTAVSGSHFAIFAAVILGMIPDTRKRVKQIVSVLFAPAALVFFGVTPSVMRAAVMFLLYGLASLMLRKANTLNSLCLAVVLICTFSPGTILDLGFAMSVLGVFGAGVVGVNAAKKFCELIPDNKAKKPLTSVVTALSVSIGAVICTSPVSVFAFKGVSLGGAFASVLLMPLMAVSMSCMALLGFLRIDLIALPIDLSMGIAGAVINGIGSMRGMWLTLDFKHAWLLAALCAAAVTFAAFGDMKAFWRYGKFAAVLVLCTLLIGQYVNGRRSEIRFTGNSTTNAAVIIENHEAVVFISGSGVGLATSISRTMREHGAVKIACLAAFGADYSGALAIRELSRMVEIDAVYSNDLAKGLLTELNVVTVPEDSRLSVSGITFAAAKPSNKDISADVILYNGRFTKNTESLARYEVYFTSSAKELPENWHNARRDKEFYISLDNGTKKISVVE